MRVARTCSSVTIVSLGESESSTAIGCDGAAAGAGAGVITTGCAATGCAPG
jgi:hypothetical protein